MAETEWRRNSWLSVPSSWQLTRPLAPASASATMTWATNEPTAAASGVVACPSTGDRASMLIDGRWSFTSVTYTCNNDVHDTAFGNIAAEEKQVRMYCTAGTGVRCCIGARQTLRVHSPGGCIFLCEMTSWPPSWKWTWSRKSDSINRFTWRTFLPNFIPIRFETTEP